MLDSASPAHDARCDYVDIERIDGCFARLSLRMDDIHEIHFFTLVTFGR